MTDYNQILRLWAVCPLNLKDYSSMAPLRHAAKFDAYLPLDIWPRRNSDDCNWIDRQLYCQDYELEFTPNVSGRLMVLEAGDVTERAALAIACGL